MTENSISTRHGVTWMGVSQVGKILMQLVSIFVLARILPADDFGLMALAGTAISFASMMRDMGTGAALIQKHELSLDLKNAVFVFNALIGISLSIIIIVISPLLSIVFKEPRLVDVLIILAPIFTLISLGAVPQALLERDSLFKHIARIELFSGFCGLTAAIIIAWRGGGVYALVAQSVISGTFATILLWIVSPWRPRFEFKLTPLKEIFEFSGNIFLFGVVNYFHRNADSMLIGRFLGVGDLGFYNIAYRILLFPLQNITLVISRSTFPAYCRNQHNPELIGKHYLATLEIIAFITAPLMALIWALREPMITLFLGERWLPAATVLAWLAPVGFFQSMVSTSGSVLNSIGRSDVLRNLGLIGVPFLTLSFVIGLPWGIEGVAAAYCIANLFWVYPVIKIVLKLLSTTFLEFFVVIIKPTIIASVIALFVCFFCNKLPPQLNTQLIKFIIGSFAGVSLYIILSWLLMRKTLIRLFSVFKT